VPELLEMQRMLRRLGLGSVCEQARCPNQGYCWSRRSVTFMLLGSVCTRACRFCAVGTGRPEPLDPEEPHNVARAVGMLGLEHVVFTSVSRDDLVDGGAEQFRRTLCEVRGSRPETSVEVLTPDFKGDLEAVATVCCGEPDVYNHNVETVPQLYRRVRPGARFERSLAVLAEARRLRPGAIVKSGLMLGLGETWPQVERVLQALRGAGVDSLTLGQYLRPTRHQLPVERYWEPEEFEGLAELARGLGFARVASAPLVRSSFDAAGTLRAACTTRAR
jgi:lipoic acid synthetase